MKTKIVVILLIVLQAILCGVIIPDPQNPILFNKPTGVYLGQSIIINFQLPAGSPGLPYKQFLGVVLPSNLGASDLQLDQPLNSPKFGCALSDGTVNYLISAVQPIASPVVSTLIAEQNIAFCRLDDNINSPLKAGVNYRLSIILTNVKVSSTNFFRNIGVFTATTNNPERIVIDYHPNIGSVGQYGDYIAYTPKALDISTVSITVTTGPSATSGSTSVYPYNNFDLYVNLKCNIFINPSNYSIVFRYPTNIVSPAQSVVTNTIVASDPLQSQLTGTLTLSTFSTDSLLLQGWTEFLIPNRQFQIVLKGWKALDNNLSTASNLEVWLYYQNTYSVVSYQFSSIFNISKATINVASISHPEYFDIWANGAWPMKFQFSVNSDLVNGGFVLIQQTNTSDNSAKFSMIATTCDFSDNDSSFDNSFGKRAPCYPFRNDFWYPSFPSNTAYAGSGVFFKVKNLLSSKIAYYVTIWGFADICGTTATSSLTTSWAQFQFIISVYKTINPNAIGESRLTGTTNVLLAQSTTSTMGNKCYQNNMTNGVAALSAVSTTTVTFKGQTLTNTGSGATPPCVLSGYTDYLLFKEITDFFTISVISTTLATFTGFDACANPAKSATGVMALSENFLYSSSNILNSNSYVYLGTTLQAGTNAASSLGQPDLMATPNVGGGNGGAVGNIQKAGKIYVQFSRAFFVAGDTYISTATTTLCYLTWQITNDITCTNAANMVASKFASVTETTLLTGAAIAAVGAYNRITTGIYMDSTNTALPPTISTNTSSTTIYRILSVLEPMVGASCPDGGAVANFQFISNKPADKQTPNASNGRAFSIFAFLTTCLKWASTLPSIKTLHTYIDVQFNYITTTSTTAVSPITKVNRFIKLFPEGGIFQDWAKSYNYGSADGSNMAFAYYSFQASTSASLSMQNLGVCILEVNGYALTISYDNVSNAIAIWIFGVSLIDTDYNDTTATYPVTPLVSNINAYGLSSANPMSATNQYLKVSSGTLYTSLYGQFGRFVSSVILVADATQTLMEINLDNERMAPSIVTTYANYAALSAVTGVRPSGTKYWQFMASLVILTGITSSTITTTSTTTYSNLIIPFYCPPQSGYVSTTSNPSMLSINKPMVMIQWISMTAWNNVTNVGKMIADTNQNDTAGTYAVPVVPTAYAFYSLTYLAHKNSQTASQALPTYATPSTSVLKFNPYTNTNIPPDNTLYWLTGTNNGAVSSTLYCASFSLFLNNFTTDATITLTGVAGSSTVYTNYSSIGHNFYLNGKVFTKFVNTSLWAPSSSSGTSTRPALLFASSNSITPDTAATAASSAKYWTGIRRPTIDNFSVSGTIVSTDRIAFYCNPSDTQTNTWVSNYVLATPVTSTSIQNYLLDFNPDNTTAWTGISFTNDKTEGVYKADPAGSLKIMFTTPATIPNGSQIIITAGNSVFTNNSMCGIVISSGAIVRECTVSSAIATCNVSALLSSFYICCYNLVMLDSVTLSSAVAYLPANAGISSLSSYITTNLYTAPVSPTNPFTWTTGQSTATDVINNTNAKFTAAAYSNVSQDTGIGKINFTISLAREPTRDLKLTIIGDLSGLLIPSNIPRCLATFGTSLGSNWDNGDILIDTCSTNSMSSATNPIVILLKRITYKCGISFSKTLTLTLWPVITVNWLVAPFSTNNYKITMNIYTGLDNIANNINTFQMPFNTQLAAKPASMGQWDTLCAVNTITPRIVNEIGDFVFSFDLDTAKALITGSSPNEVTIFFPSQYFKENNLNILNILCMYQSVLLNCSFTDTSILNIRFTSPLPIGSGTKILVYVLGIEVPGIDSSISIPCTVNQTNFSTGLRTNLITGSGKVQPIQNVAINSNVGNLVILNTYVPTDLNPRNTSTHTFRIMLDTAIGSIVQPLTIVNNPYLIVTFPFTYTLGWYLNTKATASINEFTSNSNNVITQTATITPSSVSQSGNRVTIQLSQASYTFNSNWRYWDVLVQNVVAPSDTTITTTTQTTGRFSITLTNSDYSTLYRSWSNLNTMSTIALPTAYNSWLVNNRGYQFAFDNTKWVIDVFNTLLNYITIRPGRFLAYTFLIKPNSSNILPQAANISMADPVFKTALTSYVVPTSYYAGIPFYIGATCGTAPGYYLAYWISSDTSHFAPMVPLVITVDNSLTGIISYVNPSTIPAGGSLYLFYTLSDPPFDTLSISWSPALNNKNDPTSNLTGVTIPPFTVYSYSSFSIVSAGNNNPQTFSSTNPNNCYTWQVNNISFTIQGATALIPPNTVISSYFTYFNAQTDTTLAKNTIRFSITSQYYPVYIWCALVCYSGVFPPDQNILGQNFTQNNLNIGYTNLIPSLSPFNMILIGLARGQQYKMRCIIATTQYDPTTRTSTSVTFNNYSNTNGTSVPIIAPFSTSTCCATFTFNNDPGQVTKNAIVYYCQKLYSTPGWPTNGCVVCTDTFGLAAPGMAIPLNTTCNNNYTYQQSQGPIIGNNTAVNLSVSYTICPIPHPICLTDVSGNKLYSDYFNQLQTDLKNPNQFSTVLSIINVPTFTISTLCDSSVPSTTSSSFAITGITYNSNGQVSWNATYSTSLDCYFQISNATTAPVYSTLISCQDTSRCIRNSVSPAGSLISINPSNAIAFTPGTYYLYVGCANNIPFSSQQSSVTSGGSFTISPPTPTNNSTANNTTQSTTSKYITMSILCLLILSLMI